MAIIHFLFRLLFQWRYTEWLKFDDVNGVPDWSYVYGVELYNHSAPAVDFDDENANLASVPSLKKEVETFHAMLKEGWRAALPEN